MTAPAAGIRSERVRTGRLEHHLLTAGDEDGEPVVFIHGNVSSARFFGDVLAALPEGVRGLAPDLRGFGESEAAPVDARRGLSDFSDDLAELLEVARTAGRRVHLVGWSLGSGVAMQYAIDHEERVASVLLLAAMPPWGVGATRDAKGTPCNDDYAGSGAGLVPPEFLLRLKGGDTGTASELSPRAVMRRTFVKETFAFTPEKEDVFVAEMLKCAVGEDNYPGDAAASPNWPGVAPGERGVNNALSPKYCNLAAFATAALEAPVVWLRGEDDVIVSDRSPLDVASLGEAGRIPGWPGPVHPPQPMLTQIRALLDARRENGGSVEEVVLADCGHSPHLERPERFLAVLSALVAASAGVR